MVEATLVVGSAGAVVALLACSAFFSSSETAIFTLPAGEPGDSSGADDRRAATLSDLRSDPHRLLVTLLVGNNLVNVAISSVVTVLVMETLPAGVAVTVATLVASTLVLVFGEIVPKSYGLGNAERWALTVAVPLSLVGRALYPVVVAFDVTTRAMVGVVGGEPEIEASLLEDGTSDG